MINFDRKKHYHVRVELIDQGYDANVISDLQSRIGRGTEEKFMIGVKLIQYYNSNAYAIHATDDEIRGVYEDVSFGYNGSAATFFAVCDVKFGLDKSQVSRLMNIVDEFGDKERVQLRSQYRQFTYSALCEMLPLTPEEREPIEPSWTRRQIRCYKAELEDLALKARRKEKSVAPAQQEDPDDTPEGRYMLYKPAELRSILVERDNEISDLKRQIEEFRNDDRIKELEEQRDYYMKLVISQTK
ncbi:MAG: hypothetical protein IJW99_10580 [Clostridia bacterium]|nr:hypothetical protein [Clostridia bacterium]